MLQTLLPQTAEFPDQVEVWVLDNGSNDETSKVLQDCAKLGAFNIFRQETNLGPTRNIIYGPTTLAKGEYSWVLGDHNLLRPNALKTVVETLTSSPDIDVFYVNFRVADFPNHWPNSAIGGFDGPFVYTGNPELYSNRYEAWHQLLRAYSAACTQNYVHIIRSSHWKTYWKNRHIGTDYTTAETTYPHTMTVINTNLHSPAVAIQEPCITIFSGAQSWGNPATKAKVLFTGLPDLLSHLEAKRIPKSSTNPLWSDFYYPTTSTFIRETMSICGRRKGFRLILRNLGTNLCNWKCFITTLPRALFPEQFDFAKSKLEKITNFRKSYFYNFRLARWLRQRSDDSAKPTKDSTP